jgi:hypothetical protein
MKKATRTLLSVTFIVGMGLLIMNYPVHGQDTTKVSSALPENINTIVNASCMPCHSAKGGLMSRSKLNFTEWTQYSTVKQKEKAEKIYSELAKGAMPPKFVRENHPETIPSPEQIDTIKKWVNSLNDGPIR